MVLITLLWLMVLITLLWSMAGVVSRHLEQAGSFEVSGAACSTP